MSRFLRLSLAQSLLLVALAAFATATALEVLQTQLAFTRRFEVGDIAANFRGVCAGLFIGLVVGGFLDLIERRRAAG